MRTMSTPLSPAQAAQVAGVSRWTVVRAINSQALRATRDNRNQWRIRPEDLGTWRAAHPAQSASSEHEQAVAPSIAPPAHPDTALLDEVAQLRIAVAVREERVEKLTDQLRMAAETIVDLRKSRDEAVALSRALAQRPAPEMPVEVPAVVSVAEEPSALVDALRRQLDEAEAHIRTLVTAPPSEPAEEAAAVVEELRRRREKGKGLARALEPSAPQPPQERPDEPSAGMTPTGPLRGVLARLLGR